MFFATPCRKTQACTIDPNNSVFMAWLSYQIINPLVLSDHQKFTLTDANLDMKRTKVTLKNTTSFCECHHNNPNFEYIKAPCIQNIVVFLLLALSMQMPRILFFKIICYFQLPYVFNYAVVSNITKDGYVCYRASIYKTPAVSPAFELDNLTSTEYSTWAESM